HIHKRTYSIHPVGLERTKNQRSLISFEYRFFDDMSQSCGPEHSKAYTVAWIAALPHERAAGEAMFDDEYEDPPADFIQNSGDPNAYSWGKIGKHYVVVAALPSGDYGLAPTAIVAQGLRSSLPHVRIGLLVGIGEAVREILDKEGTTVDQRDIRLGDVVVSSPEGTIGGVVQCDLVKAQTVDGSEVLQRHGSLNSPPLALRTALAKLQASYFKKGSTIIAIIAEAFEKWSEMKDKFYHPGLEGNETNRRTDTYHSRGGISISNEARRSPKIHYGTVASSNTLEKSARHRDAVLMRLAKENINPLCFEMEAAGLMNNFPCLVIRGICDYGDEHKNDHWQNYAAITAAGVAKELLRCVNVQQVQGTQGIGNLILKRHDHEVQELFTGHPVVRVQAHVEDLKLYTTKRAAELVSSMRSDGELIQDIIEAVVDACEGVFLLARLHMDSITDQLTVNEIYDTLDGLREATGSYSSAYEATMERVLGQPKRRRDLALRILAWIVHARRPLRLRELNHALATRWGKRSIDLDDTYPKEVILSVCAGLVTLDDSVGTPARLIHYTAQEFLLENWMQWFPYESTAIVDTCLTYLSFDEFRKVPSYVYEADQLQRRQYHLFEYAAKNWGYHLRDQDCLAETHRTKTETVLSFLQDTKLVLRSGQEMGKCTHGLHLTAIFGLRYLTECLIALGHNPDVGDRVGRTPLWWAASKGHAGLVKILIDDGRVDVNMWAEEMAVLSGLQTPLSAAAKNGHEAVVKVLLKDEDIAVDASDLFGHTPLSWATKNEHAIVVQMLLDTELVDINTKDVLNGRTPLSYAAENGREEMVKLLLATKKIDVNSKDHSDRTALHYAAEKGHQAVAEALFAIEETDIHSKDFWGQTAFDKAIEHNHDSIAVLLMAAGVINPHKDSIVNLQPRRSMVSFAAGTCFDNGEGST
ncbi:hypothetical protein D6C92_07144, partial [Aureobasidium pullulans]